MPLEVKYTSNLGAVALAWSAADGDRTPPLSIPHPAVIKYASNFQDAAQSVAEIHLLRPDAKQQLAHPRPVSLIVYKCRLMSLTEMSKILLVDDDQELTSAVQNFLVLQGHSVETASTGEDAIQLLTNFQYDVIVLDWGLPGIEGDELCRLYRSRGGSTPILFLTGRNNISFLAYFWN